MEELENLLETMGKFPEYKFQNLEFVFVKKKQKKKKTTVLVRNTLKCT